MHVQLAADVGQLEQVGRRLAGLDLAQLGRPVRKRELRVDLLLGRRLRQLAERGDVRPLSRSRARARFRTARAAAATTSIGYPSAVTPTTRRSSRSSTATICGSVLDDPVTDCHAARRRRSGSRGRSRGADRPPARRRAPQRPRRREPGRGSASSRVPDARSRARRAPARSAPRSSGRSQARCRACRPRRPRAARASVRIPSACPSSRMRFGESPSSRPTPTSSGSAWSSSSRSSASSPVSTSSRSRASIPGPIPASSRTRPARTSAATSAGVERISSAARR